MTNIIIETLKATPREDIIADIIAHYIVVDNGVIHEKELEIIQFIAQRYGWDWYNFEAEVDRRIQEWQDAENERIIAEENQAFNEFMMNSWADRHYDDPEAMAIAGLVFK